MQMVKKKKKWDTLLGAVAKYRYKIAPYSNDMTLGINIVRKRPEQNRQSLLKKGKMI